MSECSYKRAQTLELTREKECSEAKTAQDELVDRLSEIIAMLEAGGVKAQIGSALTRLVW